MRDVRIVFTRDAKSKRLVFYGFADMNGDIIPDEEIGEWCADGDFESVKITLKVRDA